MNMNTLSYELAKELKEAGFPQNGKGSWYAVLALNRKV